ncbi:response regulator transcription factor [Agitococcus lubricus]|uniref:LuxR family two component transcriptional regulator n=1 Tax=Agitococcus lubricus TaxID=1077255 RepID=A0A2T5IZ22_9GAMM|nr:response regulator transcription factor [Agitococcus lubricus]PTQ89277.1 LuxR family two component transcriptional regulator [Agitococcus lubricus]
MNNTRILIVDDHQLIRKGLRVLISSEERFDVIAEASNGFEAIDFLKKNHVNVVLMDVSMPDMTGIETAKKIFELHDTPHILLLTMYNNLVYIEEALKIGVSGYLLKDAAPTELFSAIDTIMNGKVYLSPSICSEIAQGFKAKNIHEKAEKNLTQRQTEILKLVSLGLSSKEIAKKLNLSLKTIETHRSQIMNKLDIHEVTGLVRYAIKMKLID